MSLRNEDLAKAARELKLLPISIMILEVPS